MENIRIIRRLEIVRAEIGNGKFARLRTIEMRGFVFPSQLLILDLARYPSVEDLAGLLPAVCLYTPDDLSHVLDKIAVKAS